MESREITVDHCEFPWEVLLTAGSRGLPRIPKGIISSSPSSRGFPWELPDSYGFPPFPREFVGILAENRGAVWELYMLAVISFGLLLLPRGSVGIPAGNRGTPRELGMAVVGSCECGSPFLPWASVGMSAGSHTI